MSLTKETEIDQIEVVSSGHVQVRRAIKILENDQVISRTYHRHVLSPGDDLSKEDPKVIAIARAAWSSQPTPKE